MSHLSVWWVINNDLISLLEKVVVHFGKIIFLSECKECSPWKRARKRLSGAINDGDQLRFVPLIAFNHPFETHFGSTFFITRWRCLHPRNLFEFLNWGFERPLPLADEQAAIRMASRSASVWNPPYLPFSPEFDHFDLSQSWERGLLHLELFRVLIQWEKINIKQNPFSEWYFQSIPFYTLESVNRKTHPLSCPYYMEG